MGEIIRIAIGVAGGMLLWEVMKALLPMAGSLLVAAGAVTFSPPRMSAE